MSHHCHAVGCTTRVPPKLFMCRTHWYMVPRPLRQAVWATYRPGQESDKRPSWEYLEATEEARRFVAELENKRTLWDAEHERYALLIKMLKEAADEAKG